jgi:cysteine desulfurase
MITAESSMRAPHILNVLVPGTRNDALLMHLDLAGVAASGGSACSSGAVEPSHVLSAMRLPTDLGITAVRFSFGHETSEADVDRVIAVFPGVVQKVRRLAGALGHG